MSAKTGIAWTDATWNPVRGCTKISAGCAHCYAQTFAERWRGIPGHPYEQGFDVRLVPEALDLPLRWRKPRRIFVNSMSDLFHEDVPDSFIADVFNVMKDATRHTFQILTKRARRMSEFVTRYTGATLPLPNVEIGVSVENQDAARERIPWLLETPAAVLIVSCEPLISAVDLTRIEVVAPRPPHGPGVWLDALRGHVIGPDDMLPAKIDWVIVGGESGPKARPCDIKWIRSLVEQTKAAGVACFVKQIGTRSVVTPPQGQCPTPGVRDRAGADLSEWPEDLRVRQMPEGS
jgi:protein gp37